MNNYTRFSGSTKILVLDTEPTWAESYCNWMGGPPPPQRKRWKAMTISELKRWI